MCHEPKWDTDRSEPGWTKTGHRTKVIKTVLCIGKPVGTCRKNGKFYHDSPIFFRISFFMDVLLWELLNGDVHRMMFSLSELVEKIFEFIAQPAAGSEDLLRKMS